MLIRPHNSLVFLVPIRNSKLELHRTIYHLIILKEPEFTLVNWIQTKDAIITCFLLSVPAFWYQFRFRLLRRFENYLFESEWNCCKANLFESDSVATSNSHFTMTWHVENMPTMPNSIIEYFCAGVCVRFVWLKCTSRNNRIVHKTKMTKRCATRLHGFCFVWSTAQIRWFEFLFFFFLSSISL